MSVVAHVTTKEIAKSRKFERQANHFTVPFGKNKGELPVES